MTRFYRLMRSLWRGYFHLFYRFSVFGTPPTYLDKAILAPNHSSFFDPPLIGSAWPEEVHYLARASLFKNRFWGRLLKKLNAHPVQGNAQDIDSFRLVCKLLNDGKKVVIFPEGVRSSTGELQSLKFGIAMLALRTQAPIIPVYISGTFEAWPRHSWLPKFGTSITCVFGKPIFPKQNDEASKKKLQENLAQKIQTSLEELKLWLESGAIGEPP